MKKIPYIFTIINIIFQIVYMTFGRLTYTELGGLTALFIIFRPEYLIISGIISIINIIAFIPMLIKNNNKACLIIMIAINIEYIIYYYCLLMKQ